MATQVTWPTLIIMAQPMDISITTLGQGLFDLLTFAIPVLIFVIGGIANAVYKQKEQERMRKRSRSQGQGHSRPNLQDLAAKRQAQLQEAARQRRQRYDSGGSQGTKTSARRGGPISEGEPGNLTMAERIERARAKAQYADRAEDLQSGGQSPRSREDHGRWDDVEDDQAAREAKRRSREQAQHQKYQEREHARRERDEQQALERRRQQQATAQRQSDRMRYQQDRPGQPHPHSSHSSSTHRRVAPQPGQSTPRGSTQPYGHTQATPYSNEDESAASAYTPEEGERWHNGDSLVHETQIGTGAARPSEMPTRHQGSGPPQGRQLRILLSNRQSIRQAIITKEVLDKPLALREREGGVGA